MWLLHVLIFLLSLHPYTHIVNDGDSPFVGLQGAMRLSVNTLRVKDGAKQLAGVPDLDEASWSFASDLAAKDQAYVDPEDVAFTALLDRAHAAGFNGTTVKANVHTEEARDGKDVEGACMACIQTWVANKESFALIQDPKLEYVGSGGAKSASGRAFYVQLYAA